jgi:hypothetical protein
MGEVVDPWIVQPVKQYTQVPNGFYTAIFKGVEDITLEKDGSLKWRFTWEVKTGPEAGHLATSLESRSINPMTEAGRLVGGLLGRELVQGESVKAAIEACIGKIYMVNVAVGDKGGKPQVRSCGKPPAM